MSSPKTLDFPLPPPRGSIHFSPDLRSPPPSQSPNFSSSPQQQLSKVLDLTNKYRRQAVALLARQEALQAEQKNVFELERQLWITEREIWEEERRILASGAPSSSAVANREKQESNASVPNGVIPMLSPGHSNNATRFLSVSSMADSHAEQGIRGRESSGGGSGIGWFLKQGTPMAANVPLPDVSPKSSHPEMAPKYGSISEMSLTEGIPEEALEDDDLAEIPQSLIAEATKLVYGEKTAKRASFSSNGTMSKRPVLFTSLSENSSSEHSQKSIRRVSSSATVKNQNARNPQYMATFSDEDQSDNERDIQTPQPPKAQRRVRKRSASHADKTSDEPPVPLRLRPASNFGTAFGSTAAVRGQPTFLQPPRSGSIHSTFYHPETPIDNFSSFRDNSWKPSDNSFGGASNNSNLTVKPAPQPMNLKSAPWGVTSTSITSPLTSPTFGKDMSQGLKPPPSPSNITSSLSISSGNNTPARLPGQHLDKGYSHISQYSDDGDVVEIQTNGHQLGADRKGKTSPPTYTWAPPPPRPTSPTRSTSSSRRSGLYGNTILLSPSTVAPSMKTSNPRLSAVGGLPPFSPTMGRMGTSSMLLSVSSRSENGDDDEDEELSDEEERSNSLGRLSDPRVHSTTSMEVPMRLGGGIAAGLGVNMGMNGNGPLSSVRTVDGYVEPPAEVVKDNSMWGDVMPGGMI